MPYDAKAVANYFLDLAEAKSESLTPMKLQKLVYFAHGWHLAITGKPLINEVVQAWSFGPVIRSLYIEFRDFGATGITERAKEYVPTPREAGKPGFFSFRQITPSINDASYVSEDTPFTKSLLDKIWDVYGCYTAIQLSNMTHAPNTPWDKIKRQYAGPIPKNEVIPDHSIKEYFVRESAG